MRPIITLLWIALSLLSFKFIDTGWLAYHNIFSGCTDQWCINPEHVRYPKDLVTGDKNDDVVILFGWVFAIIPVALNIFRLKSSIRRGELFVHLFFLGHLSLFLMSRQQTSIWTTIVADGNITLALWLTALAGLWISYLVVAFQGKQFARTETLKAASPSGREQA